MTTETNKDIVRRFNVEVIEQGSLVAFQALVAPDFINWSAPSGGPNGAESLWNTFETILRPALSGLTVTIHDQLAEGDRVTTRKTVSGIHTGPLLGRAASGKPLSIDVIDIVRIRDGRYVEHWGINTLPALLAELDKRA